MRRIHRPNLWHKLLLLFLRRLLSSEEYYEFKDDIDEVYQDIVEKDARWHADFWYGCRILESLPSAIIECVTWRWMMFTNYLKIALRNIQRQKGYAFINIAGLAVGMACLLLILLYVNYEFGYESHNPDAERVYRIYVEHHESNEVFRTSSTPVPLVEALHKDIPAIEDFSRFDALPRLVASYKDKRFVETDMVAVDPGVFDILGFQLMTGDKKTALQDVYSIVVTEDIAEKYFGEEDPVGKTLVVDGSLSLMVRGVMRNHPSNTNFDPDILVSFSTIKEVFGSGYTTNWLSQVLQSYILVPEDHSVEMLEKNIEASFSKYRAKENDERRLKLERLSRMHLYSIFGNQGIRTITIFLAVGVLIILTACINFMNLATARSAKRAREVGMRKVAGAQKNQIIGQFLGESFVYALLSLILGILLAAVSIPLLRNITGQSLHVTQMGQMPILLSLVGTLVLVGFVSGSYPALYLSAFRPVSVLKESFGAGKSGTLFRKILVVSQFSVSIMLIICTFLFTCQIDYMINMPLGFKQDQIVVIRNPGRGSIEPFKQMLAGDSRVVSICGSVLLPHSIGRYNEVTWEGADNNETIAIKHNTVDYEFLKTYEIPLLAGRNFSRDFTTEFREGSRDPRNAGAVLLNETAVERFGWDEPIGKKVIQVFGELRLTFTVIGVVKDFHFSSLRNPIVPLKIFLGRQPSTYISIKIQPQDIQSTLKKIESAWKSFNPNAPFEYFFYDSVFAQLYQQEKNLRTLFQYFSFLAIFIACLGLFGLASFAAERRTKEIGIRKILGASSQGLVLLLSKEFTKWVLIANIVAWPVAYYVMSQWLSGYAYRTSIDPLVFILSSFLALVLALFTVSVQSIRAALANPTESLKYE